MARQEWTKEEYAYLMKWYAKKGPVELAKELPHSVGSIVGTAARLRREAELSGDEETAKKFKRRKAKE